VTFGLFFFHQVQWGSNHSTNPSESQIFPLHLPAWTRKSPLQNAAERFVPLHFAAERFTPTRLCATERFTFLLYDAAGVQSDLSAAVCSGESKFTSAKCNRNI
jgi:hypothetical protein